MKNLFILFVILLLSKSVLAQKELLTFDEQNKYIYYQVTEMPGITADTLYNRCLSGLKQYYRAKNVKPETEAGSAIIIKSSMTVYSNTSMAKHEDGEMAYTMHVEFKDGKYRYWVTDFIFSPYQRNRYGVYEKVPGSQTPLETAKSKSAAHSFDTYMDQTAKFCKDTGDNLKLYTTTPVKKQPAPAKVDTRKW